jgi:aspartate/methionine/tyrosine aminotransferase
VPAAEVQRCTCLLLNYPNNPTGVVVDKSFWQQVLQFCDQHDLLLIHDNPYQSQVRISHSMIFNPSSIKFVQMPCSAQVGDVTE